MLPLIAGVAARVLAPTIGRAVAGQALKAGVSAGTSQALGTAARYAAPTVARQGAKALTGGGEPATQSPSGGGWLSQMNAGSVARVNRRAEELQPYT